MRRLFLLLFILSRGALSVESPTLIGGRIADAGDFPEVIYISSGSSRCSATIIGKRTILTASHCVRNNGSIHPVEFVVNQQVFSAVCEHHPDYENLYSYDFALCKTNQNMDVKPASIGKHSPEIGQEVTLSGYGCIHPRRPDGSQRRGGNDGRLRWGLAKVTRLPGNGIAGGQYFYTNDDTALCFGDSGGPAMLSISNPKKDNHIVIGVNSRGNIIDRSLLSSTFLNGFQNWAYEYANENDVEICGINSDCKLKPEPKPECKRENKKVNHYKRKLEKWNRRLEKCEQRELF